jgi:hypothetical protein
MLPSTSLLPSTKCHKLFSNFLLIADYFLSLLLLGFFKIDSNFILSCGLSYSHIDNSPYLVVLP